MNTHIHNVHQIAIDAAKWLITLKEADEMQRQEFLAWLSSSPGHVGHFLSTTDIDRALDSLRDERKYGIDYLISLERGHRTLTDSM